MAGGLCYGFVAPLPVFNRTNVINCHPLHRRLTSPCHHRPNPVTTTTTRPKQQTPHARVRRGRKPAPVIPDSLYDAEPISDIDYKPFDFSTLRDKVVLVVNVASEDQFTDEQYKSLCSLLDDYQAGGFEVLAFPSNWYGQYETKSQDEIKKFVHETYTDKVTLMSKTDLEWNPIFALAKKYFPGEIIWNFHGKFLFGRKGLPVARFDLLSTHKAVEEKVSLYVNSRDPNIHDSKAPDPSTVVEEEDYFSFSPEVSEEKEKEESDEEDEEGDDISSADDASADADSDETVEAEADRDLVQN